MKTTIMINSMMLVCLITIPCLAKDGKKYGSPKRFEKDIQKFEAADKKQAPVDGGIVCIGSSSMRGWHGNIKKDLAPLNVIPRGFGGSNMNDALHYANNLIAAECKKDNRLTFVDVASGMLDNKGYPKKDIFKKDNLHMTRPGYEIWRDILKPALRD